MVNAVVDDACFFSLRPNPRIVVFHTSWRHVYYGKVRRGEHHEMAVGTSHGGRLDKRAFTAPKSR